MYHTRCMGLYHILETRLRYWKQHLGLFWENFRNSHKLKQNMQRSDLSVLPKILITDLVKTAINPSKGGGAKRPPRPLNANNLIPEKK